MSTCKPLSFTRWPSSACHATSHQTAATSSRPPSGLAWLTPSVWPSYLSLSSAKQGGGGAFSSWAQGPSTLLVEFALMDKTAPMVPPWPTDKRPAGFQLLLSQLGFPAFTPASRGTVPVSPSAPSSTIPTAHHLSSHPRVDEESNELCEVQEVGCASRSKYQA